MKTSLIITALLTTSLVAGCNGGKSKTPVAAPVPGTAPITGTPLGPNNSPAFGQGVGPALPLASVGGLGFYSVQAAGVPAVIQAAAASVFEIRILGSNEKGIKFVDVSHGKGRALKEKILSPENKDRLGAIVLIKQLEFCERSKDLQKQKECVLNGDIHQSTGFVAGDSTTLWTAAHSVDAFLKLIELGTQKSTRDQLKERPTVALFIFDSRGQLIFDPYNDTAKIRSVPRMTETARVADNFYAADSDYISLRLSRAIGNPLRFANLRPALGQTVFVLGFPACTGCEPNIDRSAMGEDANLMEPLDFANRAPAPNSDGQGLKISMGRVISPYGLETFFEMQFWALQILETRRMVFHTADSQHGESGGPTLNQNGEVIAIHGGGKGRIFNGLHQRISRGAIPAGVGL